MFEKYCDSHKCVHQLKIKPWSTPNVNKIIHICGNICVACFRFYIVNTLLHKFIFSMHEIISSCLRWATFYMLLLVMNKNMMSHDVTSLQSLAKIIEKLTGVGVQIRPICRLFNRVKGACVCCFEDVPQFVFVLWTFLAFVAFEGETICNHVIFWVTDYCCF